uniref:Cytochrome c oxidase subunit 3 n=1 Tax=Batracomorphus lateprocessus TaxID=1962545 RepID=A0A6C0N9M8_9HEMI|nr:cytochrome c oxidase subunit III [Batracomorphus lateprocessus]YP_010879004.1 cytochrome c oxidase subunit III [Batracomorphus matsumurai]QHW07513.1 cytochrome c oxidase subunit III [Batracomorphus lateprocessus]WHE42656.1 cytochrome c oxidase subunit 3 [Batracomorphus matsumurai]
MNNHQFHMVNNSPWPILASMSVFSMMTGSIMWMKNMNMYTMMLGMMMIFMVSYQWWRDIVRESTFQGMHNKKISQMMKWGMMMFIISEVMFFLSFFWAFFHMSLAPSMEVGMNWPPMGIKSINAMNIPLLNTIILLSSGISITWAHNSMLIKMFNQTMKSLIITILMAIYFTMIQMYEYLELSFTIADSVFGSTFFLMTGFHGIHVIIGTVFILTSTIRMKKLHFSSKHMVGFESSAWYWHFVDLVWLFLYISVYWWGM